MRERPIGSTPFRQRSRYGWVLVGTVSVATTALLASAISLTVFADQAMFADQDRTALSQGSALQRIPSAQRGFAQIAATVKPAVIGVRARTVEGGSQRQSAKAETDPAPHATPETRPPRFNTSVGSGFFITADGYAVTNNHVVKGSSTAEVRTDDGKTYRSRVVATDPSTDLALLKVDDRNDFAHVHFADEAPSVGDWIITVGNPFGFSGTVTAGIVSAQGRDVGKESGGKGLYDLIQIDAPVNRGDSGGPTFDLAGNVIGVNTMIFSPTGASVGIAFAIPSSRAKPVIEQLKDRGSVARGWLGIHYQTVSPAIADSLKLEKPSGVLVADVQPGGPAAEAGLVAGDLVNSVNGETIGSARDFTRALDDTAPGSVVILGVAQKGNEKFITATVGEPPPPEVPKQPNVGNQNGGPERPQLGLALAPAGAVSDATRRGALVVGVDPGGLAAGRGIDPGDVILDVAQQAVTTPEDVYRIVADAQRAGSQSVLVRIRSGDTAQFIALPIG
jgi:serine protease Do